MRETLVALVGEEHADLVLALLSPEEQWTLVSRETDENTDVLSYERETRYVTEWRRSE